MQFKNKSSKIILILLLIVMTFACYAENGLVYSLSTASNKKYICLASINDKTRALELLDQVEVEQDTVLSCGSDRWFITNGNQCREVIIDYNGVLSSGAEIDYTSILPSDAIIVQLINVSQMIYYQVQESVFYIWDGKNSVRIGGSENIHGDIYNKIKMNTLGTKVAFIDDKCGLYIFNNETQTTYLLSNRALAFDWISENELMFWEETLTMEYDLYTSEIKVIKSNVDSSFRECLMNSKGSYITLPNEDAFVAYAMNCSSKYIVTVIYDNAFSWDGDPLYLYIVNLQDCNSWIAEPYFCINGEKTPYTVQKSKGSGFVYLVRM